MYKNGRCCDDKFFKTQKYYKTSLRANTKTENDVSLLENYNTELNKHFALCAKIKEDDSYRQSVNYFLLICHVSNNQYKWMKYKQVLKFQKQELIL